MATRTKKDPQVESDTDWAAKVTRLANRKPAEDWLTVPDLDALADAQAAEAEALRVQRSVHLQVVQKNVDETDRDVLAALVQEHPDVLAATERLRTAMEAVTAAEVNFHFRALPPTVYENLQLQHPPTADQEKHNLAYDPDTYVPALIAACSVRPLTSEQVAALIEPNEDGFSAFNDGDIRAMFEMCQRLNERPRLMLGKGSRPTQV